MSKQFEKELRIAGAFEAFAFQAQFGGKTSEKTEQHPAQNGEVLRTITDPQACIILVEDDVWEPSAGCHGKH